MTEKINGLKEVINKITNKNFTFYFFTMDTLGNPSAGVANIYEHVKVLNELGYNATILHQEDNYRLKGDEDGNGLIDWLGEEYGELPHISVKTKELTIGPQDFIIVPEIFATVMDLVKGFPCKKIVLSQSYDYLLELLPLGSRWSDYGFNDVITTSEIQENYLKTLFPELNYSIVPISIPEYFKPSDKPKVPVISILTRDPGDAQKIAKSFYLQNPLYKWVTFRELRGLSRIDFAQTLGESCLSVWVDETSGFGTFPIESFESDTPIIGVIPKLVPEWMINKGDNESTDSIKNNGIWTSNINNIPELISNYLNLWLEDNLPEKLISDIVESKGKYTIEKQKNKIKDVYSVLVNNRVNEFNDSIIKLNENEENGK